jgi:transcriptional repressor NrdR
MKCPYCGAVDFDKVLDSRPVRDNSAVKRRRECDKQRGGCGRRFTTFEQIEELQLQVIKKHGGREPFDRNKLIASIIIALRKRPVSSEQIEQIAEDIEREITNHHEVEVSTRRLGELVMQHLMTIAQVAYVRFASVYTEFEDAAQFRDIVNRLSGQKQPV